MNPELILIKDTESLNTLILEIKDQEYIAFDTETTGLTRSDLVMGISLCYNSAKAYYIVLNEWDKHKSELKVILTKDNIAPLLAALVNKNLIAHNAPFDCMMMRFNFGIDLMPYVHTDTLVLGHLLNENRKNGLKELGEDLLAADAKKEQIEMKVSVKANGGVLTEEKYELYKADGDLLGKYGAKDAWLTLELFYLFVDELYVQGLERFFYEDESMPLLRTCTYDLNLTGVKVDLNKLETLKAVLEIESLELKSFIYQEIQAHIKDKYPGTKKTNTFNIGAPQQLAWLLFEKLNNNIGGLTDSGRDICRFLKLKTPYSPTDKQKFVDEVKQSIGIIYEDAQVNPKTKKLQSPKKIATYWKYCSTDDETLQPLAKKYKWVEALLKFNKNKKLLSTYIQGIQDRVRYGVIYPSFLQHGTTSGRYSSRDPNFQNLPKTEKRIKECIVSRPGRVFVGADYAQLEPRVFASVSQDPTLMSCFAKGEDFYSVVGRPIFDKTDTSLYKKDENSFANKHPELRDISKAFALATPYGTSAWNQSRILKMSQKECQDIIDKYFAAYPKVELMMMESHQQVRDTGQVMSIYGRPRRIPAGKDINKIYGEFTPHSELPYEVRTLLNLGMNHRVQSSAASIVNRAAIAIWNEIHKKGLDAKIVLQVHDELVVECKEEDAKTISELVKRCMETTSILPGVVLVAEPKIDNNLADLK